MRIWWLGRQGTTTCTRIARGFGSGSSTGFAAVRERATAHTILSVATSERTRGIASKSTGGGRRGRRLQYRTCSTRVRNHKTIGLPCGATSRRAGSGCADRRDLGSSLRRVRDPRQQTGDARWRTCPAIMTQVRMRGSARLASRISERFSLWCSRSGRSEPIIRLESHSSIAAQPIENAV